MFSKKHTLHLPVLTLLFLSLPQTAPARSLYVISDTLTSRLQAYEVDDTNLGYQTDYVCQSDPAGTTGAVGLAIHASEDEQFVFVTFEGENQIELVNAKTMEYNGVVTAPEASDLAGIVVEKGKNKVYTVDRRTNHLYVYSWNAVAKELTLDLPYPYYVQLEDCYQGYGLALDEENARLYVGDNTTTVKYYDANDPNWSKLGEFTITDKAIGIAVDVANQYVYTGSSQFGDSTYLTQYDLSTSSETRLDINTPVIGIAVDQQTGLVYLTTFGSNDDEYYEDPPKDRLFVFDSNLTQHWVSDDIGNPAM